MTQNDDQVRNLQSSLDLVYFERNALAQLVAALLLEKGYKAGIGQDTDPDWPTAFIETPAGQMSWHLPAAQVNPGLPEYPGKWDGHSTIEKYKRLRKYTDELLTPSPPLELPLKSRLSAPKYCCRVCSEEVSPDYAADRILAKLPLLCWRCKRKERQIGSTNP